MNSEKCKAITHKTGEQCKMTGKSVDPSNGLCKYHNPKKKVELQKMARSGGLLHARAMPKINENFKVQNLHDAKRLAEHTLSGAGKGIIRVNPRDLAGLLKIYIELSKETDLEKRLKAAEREQQKKKDLT